MIRYEFPWPPSGLSPNAREHWRTVAALRAQYKHDCGWAIRAAGVVAIPSPVTAQVTFVVPDKRRRDTDNHSAMLKPLWDILVELKVLEDDSHDKLRILEPKWERGEKKVIVELSPCHDGGE